MPPEMQDPIAQDHDELATPTPEPELIPPEPAAAATEVGAEDESAEAAPAGEGEQTLGDAISAGLAAVSGGDDAVDEEGIPQVGERARERYRELIKARKEAEEKLSATQAEIQAWRPLAEQHQQLMLGLAELGIGQDMWQAFFDFASATKSQNPADLQRALQLIESQRAELAERLSGSGVEVAGFDPLDTHPDLKARVEAYEISREDALKLARLEALERQRQAQPPQGYAPPASPSPGAFSPAALESARGELNALHAELAGADPDFQALFPALTQVAGRILVSAPREQWVPLIRQAYGTLKQEAAKNARQSARRPRPIASTPAGGVGKGVPTSLRDAISAGLASVRAGQ